jgi:glycerophosphoryl diester phosphodiesterase
MMKSFRIALMLGLASLPAVAIRADEFPFARPVQPPRRVQVMAHRGAHGLAPENTAAAIEESIADSVDWVEVDVRLASDGRHVVIHDATLERTTDGSGRVADRSAASLKGLDAGLKFSRRFAGEKVPTLAEVLAIARDRANLYLDCKEIDPAQLARDITYAGMERQVVVVARPDVLRAVRSAPGGDRLAVMPKWKAADGLSAFHDDLKPAAVEIQAGDVTAEACRFFHGRALKVLAVALKDNDRAEVWDRVIEAGADWVQTDRAEEVLARESLKRIPTGRVKVAHHRQASRYAPENTLPALEKSIRLGADLIDFDVCTSRDGVPVLMHDATLDRTTNARGPVRQRDAAELARLDAGKWFGLPYAGTPVPTLEAFLHAAGDRAELYLDAKDITPEAIVAVLRSQNLIERTAVHAKVDDLVRLRTLEPRLRRVPNLLRRPDLDDLIDRVHPYAIDAHLDILSKDVIDRCHAKGVKVFTVTHGAEESVETCLRAIRDGVDVIQTDHPVRVLRALELSGGSRR